MLCTMSGTDGGAQGKLTEYDLSRSTLKALGHPLSIMAHVPSGIIQSMLLPLKMMASAHSSCGIAISWEASLKPTPGVRS